MACLGWGRGRGWANTGRTGLPVCETLNRYDVSQSELGGSVFAAPRILTDTPGLSAEEGG